jgi:cytochrome c553
MTPHPPDLPSSIPAWDAAELFYIVKHGIKFTGMPGWPAQQRDDEVWAMVAFLRALPELGPDEYRRLVQGTSISREPNPQMHDLPGARDMPRVVLENCGRCHGSDGLGRGNGAFPKLAGQSRAYLFGSLEAFARGERHSGIMGPVAAALEPSLVDALARYYAGLPAGLEAEPGRLEAAAFERGRAIAHNGLPKQRVPSCVSCHGAGEIPRNPMHPVLAGQYAAYLELQLELFKSDRRGGTPFAHLMQSVARGLKRDQMRDVAVYFSSLSPDSAAVKAPRKGGGR